MRKSVLFSGAIVAAVVLSGVRVYADDAQDIEADPIGTIVTYDNQYGVGYDANNYPVISVVASQPGFYGGHTYTGYAVLAEDQSASLDLFISLATLTNLNANPSYTLAAGDGVQAQGTYSPFDGIPEVTFTTIAASNNYLKVTSTGNSVPAAPVFTINQLTTLTGNGSNVLSQPGIAGTFIEIQNATISGSTGSFQHTFPLETQANTTDESYTITDGSGSIELFDWTTSYSDCGALGGSPVPTGPVDIYGFYDSFNEFVPLQIVPEPSTFILAGLGLVGGLLAMRRRRS